MRLEIRTGRRKRFTKKTKKRSREEIWDKSESTYRRRKREKGKKIRKKERMPPSLVPPRTQADTLLPFPLVSADLPRPASSSETHICAFSNKGVPPMSREPFLSAQELLSLTALRHHTSSSTTSPRRSRFAHHSPCNKPPGAPNPSRLLPTGSRQSPTFVNCKFSSRYSAPGRAPA